MGPVTAAETRLRMVGVGDLIPTDMAAWRSQRESPARRWAVSVLGRRFRRDPGAYLRAFEEALIKRTLPFRVFSPGPPGRVSTELDGKTCNFAYSAGLRRI